MTKQPEASGTKRHAAFLFPSRCGHGLMWQLQTIQQSSWRMPNTALHSAHILQLDGPVDSHVLAS